MASTMLDETRAIPSLVGRALGAQGRVIADVAADLRQRRPRGLVTVARGSSDHAAEYASRLIGRRLGLIGASLPPSLVTLDRAPLDFADHLVLAVSQSGRSPDVVETLAAAGHGGATTLALVNAPSSPLADAAAHVLAVDAGPERAVAATKSYVLSLLQIARLVAAWAADEALPRAFDGLPVALAAALEVDVRPFAARLAEASSTYVVGRGLAFATAREAALKLKEVGGLHAEACSGAEIMHGPKALLTPSWPVLAITGADVPHDVEATTLRTLAALTDALIVLGPRDPGCGQWIASPRAPDASLQPLVDATALFVVIEAVARTRGRDPDAPPHLRKVTETR